MEEKTTWRKELEYIFKKNKDSFDNVVKNTMSAKEMDKEFPEGGHSIKGIPFTVWTKDFVYFPLCHDGSEWIGSAPRNPCDIKLKHQGGG